SALLAQRAQPLPGFTVQLGERHALVDRRVEWPVCLRRAGITTGQRAPMLPLHRRAATIRPPWVSTSVATTSASCTGGVPAAACTPRAVTARPPVPTARALAPRPATAATICFTPRPARALAGAPSARVVRRGGRLLGVSFVAVLSLAGHHNPSPLFNYVPSLPADAGRAPANATDVRAPTACCDATSGLGGVGVLRQSSHPHVGGGGLTGKCGPAVSYSPTTSRSQYHRR